MIWKRTQFVCPWFHFVFYGNALAGVIHECLNANGFCEYLGQFRNTNQLEVPVGRGTCLKLRISEPCACPVRVVSPGMFVRLRRSFVFVFAPACSELSNDHVLLCQITSAFKYVRGGLHRFVSSCMSWCEVACRRFVKL